VKTTKIFEKSGGQEPLSNSEGLEIRKRGAKRQSAKKRRKRRPITQACFDIECSSVRLKQTQSGRLSCNPTCARITCPLEGEQLCLVK